MNLRTGLFRVWIVCTLLWVSYAIWRAAQFDYLDLFDNADADKYGGIPTTHLDKITDVFKDPGRVAWVIGPPITLFAVGAVLIWILAGFRRPRSN